MKLALFAVFFTLASFSCQSQTGLIEAVKDIDLLRYAGKWYEIASVTGYFQKGCECTTAEYQIIPADEHIRVINRCFRNGKWSQIEGKAFRDPARRDGKLKEQFFWPFRADYWVIDLAPDYNWAVVSGPELRYLWILSRTPQMDENTFQSILSRLKTIGFDPSRLSHTRQKGC